MAYVDEAYIEGHAQRRFSRAMLWSVCAAVTAATVVASFSRNWWVAELFSHFRLYYLLAQAMLIMVFLNTRRFAWLVVTVALVLPNAWYVGPYLLPMLPAAFTAEAATTGPQLVAVNLNYRNQDYEKFVDYVNDVSPDLLVLSEYTPAWRTALADQLAEYPYRAERPQSTPFGTAVFSRLPFEDARWIDLGAPASQNLHITMILGGRRMELFAVHLYPPTSSRRAAWRRQQLERLAQLTAAAPSPRIVIGDLNLTPFSPLFRDLLGASGLLDARQAQGFHVTWPSLPLPLWIPIDHCLADSSAGIAQVHAGPALGSDHYPLEVTITGI